MNESLVDVTFFDTTLRDGAQALPEEHQFPTGSKNEIADHIASVGIGVIEAGFPRTLGDGEEVRKVAEVTGNTKFETFVWQNGVEVGIEHAPPVIAGLSRTTFEDIEKTWESVAVAHRPRIHTFVSTDAEHMAAKFAGKNADEVLDMGRQAVRYAKELTSGHAQADVEFSAEAASTTDNDYLERVIKTAIDEGADVINVPDTVGERHPFWMNDFYKRVIGWVIRTNPGITISAHNHNDLGMAVANSFALVHAASQISAKTEATIKVQLETAFCGLGERAGNADVFPVVGNIFKHADSLEVPVRWRFNPDLAVSAARNVLAFAGIKVDRQNPIVGSDINVHRSGIHSDGVIKGGHRIYTPHDPTAWGHAENARHEEGRYQGRKGREMAHVTT